MQHTKKNFHKRLNVRIGIAFYNLLITHPIYKDNPKVVSCAYYFLKEVLKYNGQDGSSSQVKSTIVKDLFKHYATGSYKLFIDALEDLGLLIVVDSYCPQAIDKNGKGWCKSYKITKLAIELLSQSETEYLKRLMDDKNLKRSVQKSISFRKVYKKEYSNYVLNYICDALVHTSFDSKLALEMMRELKMNEAAKTLTVHHLIDFTEKNFSELEVNETTGRAYNSYAACKSEVRQCSIYKKDGLTLHRQFTIDIRACHPTFFSSYILSHVFPFVKDARQHSTTYHALNDQLDALKTSRNRIARTIYKNGKYNKEKHDEWRRVVHDQGILEKQLSDYLNDDSFIM